VARLTQDGLRVSTVKHAHHAFDIDHEGTDSYRHRAAGAGEVAIVSGRRWALMHELRNGEAEPSLDDVLARLAPCDLVIVEGYKRDRHPKIETRRVNAAGKEPLSPGDPTIVAIASDSQITDSRVPVFDLDDIEGIAAFARQFAGI